MRIYNLKSVYFYLCHLDDLLPLLLVDDLDQPTLLDHQVVQLIQI